MTNQEYVKKTLRELVAKNVSFGLTNAQTLTGQLVHVGADHIIVERTEWRLTVEARAKAMTQPIMFRLNTDPPIERDSNYEKVLIKRFIMLDGIIWFEEAQ